MSSVVAPGLTALPPSARARAASRPAIRMASITSGVRTPSLVSLAGCGLSTYSGRAIDMGTGRRGVCWPGLSGERTGMTSPYDEHGDAVGSRYAHHSFQNRTVAYWPT